MLKKTWKCRQSWLFPILFAPQNAFTCNGQKSACPLIDLDDDQFPLSWFYWSILYDGFNNPKLFNCSWKNSWKYYLSSVHF